MCVCVFRGGEVEAERMNTSLCKHGLSMNVAETLKIEYKS